MSNQQTLDSLTPPQSDALSLSHSSSPAPPLSTTLSSSRLNASAPEFVPGRTTSPRMMIPPPRILHMYHHHHPPPPPFHIPVTGPHERRKDRRKKDQTETGASASIDPKSGLPEDIVQKIVNQVQSFNFYCFFYPFHDHCSSSTLENTLLCFQVNGCINHYQVEYYFGDLNLATTDLLMRFISKDSQGYVPLNVIASFNKIKTFINSNSQLATVLQNSSKLSRIVIAKNLPEDHCYRNLMKIFSAVGSVKHIRTCQPQNTGYGFPSAAKSGKTDFSNKVHAFVEYERVELAEKAVAELNEERSWRSGLRVRLMLQDQTKEANHVLQGGGRKEEDDAMMRSDDKQFEDCGGERDGHVQEQTVGEEEQGHKKRRGHNRVQGGGGGGGRSENQNENAKQNQNHSGRGNHHPSNSQRNKTDEVSMGNQQQQPPPGPRMPDGTRGFSLGRGKPVTVHAQ
ncbi:hypothetical protein CARUB_v10019416mg [Capsella rubella]|uniref:HTH La-type RNA-binding domain-containing protein n=1 Tax=Capsella rubella TaxID=81985 RepID=R0H253_9BRAS|nr:hypothetical protein CARUB_v10019416mg [Capsella rubella]